MALISSRHPAVVPSVSQHATREQEFAFRPALCLLPCPESGVEQASTLQEKDFWNKGPASSACHLPPTNEGGPTQASPLPGEGAPSPGPVQISVECAGASSKQGQVCNHKYKRAWTWASRGQQPCRTVGGLGPAGCPRYS